VWVSAPSAIASAEDKAAQIAAAHRVGFAVPNTVWTNDIDEARTLATRRETVVKTVTAAHWESDDEAAFVFAHPLTVDALPGSDEAFAAAPAVLQDRVEPKRDVRVTVAGGTVLAAETSVNQLDWRFTPQATWQPHELPVKASERCRSLVAELHLKFGGIDLALDTQGTYWFLEINANGEWGWLQARGLPIASALADVLHPTDES
jgi:glutathione synthase/RimK-type ligase-like ATP-grasp enzyme